MNFKFWKSKKTFNFILNNKIDAMPYHVGIHPFANKLLDPNSIWKISGFRQEHSVKPTECVIKPVPCERCGACCAYFLVSFPNVETDKLVDGVVPIEMTLPLNSVKRFMKGTQSNKHRCIALEGKVGTNVKCTIYLNRPSTCRNFIRSWETDTGNDLCGKSRAAHGLQPFSQY